MKTALKLDHVSFDYGQKAALKDVSFSVADGTFCALLGPNGAGKSTLFSLLSRLRIPAKGQIDISGRSLLQDPMHGLAGMGIVFQQPTLDLDTTVRQNLIYFAGLHGLRGVDAHHSITRALTRMRMSERADEKVRLLNGGHRRRMEIARALVHNPRILLLDEPTVGLDAQSRKDITDHVHDLVAEGLAVLWATHLVDEIGDHDQVVLLHEGRIIADGPAQTLRGEDRLLDWYLHRTHAENVMP
jgi:ABC-2 type transport system ATP-binding protein